MANGNDGMFLNYHFNIPWPDCRKALILLNLNGFKKEKAGIMPAFSLLQQGSREFQRAALLHTPQETARLDDHPWRPEAAVP